MRIIEGQKGVTSRHLTAPERLRSTAHLNFKFPIMQWKTFYLVKFYCRVVWQKNDTSVD